MKLKERLLVIIKLIKKKMDKRISNKYKVTVDKAVLKTVKTILKINNY